MTDIVWEDEVDRNYEIGAMVDAVLEEDGSLRRMRNHEAVATKAAMAALAEGRLVYALTPVGSDKVEKIVDIRSEYGRGGPATFEVVFAGGYTRIVLPGATFWVERAGR